MPRAQRTFLLVALFFLPILAAAQDPRKDVLAADKRRFTAMIQKDMKTLETLLAPDLTYVHSNGNLETRAQFLDTLRTEKLRFLAVTPAGVTVRVFGDTAVVNGVAQMKVRASSQKQELTMSLRFTEVWVRSGGAWKMAAWQSTRVDG